jgi:hypothetical protein
MAKHGRLLLLSPLAVLIPLYLTLLKYPPFYDFEEVFYPAIHSAEPYTAVPGFVNPQWVLLALFPFRLLPSHPAAALWVIISVIIIAYVVYQLGGKPSSYFLIFINPFFFSFYTAGNVEALVLLGLVIEYRPLDVLLMGIKPQLTILAIIRRLADYGRKSWLWLLAFLLLTLLLWGLWPVDMLASWGHGPNHAASMDIFPYGLLVGIPVLIKVWRRASVAELALLSYLFTPFITPSAVFALMVIALSIFSTRGKIAVFVAVWSLLAVDLLLP